MKVYTQEDVLEVIRKEIETSSLRAVAELKGFSAPLLSDMMLGKRNISEKVAEAFGFVREVTTEVTFRRAS
jgi:hypothetical protein